MSLAEAKRNAAAQGANVARLLRYRDNELENIRSAPTCSAAGRAVDELIDAELARRKKLKKRADRKAASP